jgi:hypothetical protein
MQQLFSMQRKAFERRWYDNNFFDDGHHFRYVSRTTGKIMDVNDHAGANDPKRAIPKASRQIRGVANLLSQADYTPVVYPERPQVGGPNYDEAFKLALDHAKKIGSWVQCEWKNQELIDKIAQMIILTSKNSVSYLQVWADEFKQEIKTKVWDAFDIYVQGQLTDIYDSPVIIKCVPMLINAIQSDEHFPEEQREKLNPDNKYASSEIKEAYMRARYGFNSAANDATATVLFKEAYIKEYLDEKNLAVIQKQDNADLILEGKQKGDTVIRQIMSAGGVWLKDVYTDLPEYPFVDLRMEPGTIYQTSLIERFIPSNKSLDTLMSRLEKYANTMITGTWMKRKGETFEVTNVAGAQVIEYETTPPIQGQMANVPPFYFEAIGLLNSFIEEQGVNTSALGQVPTGVKAGVAIESLKESEYANLKIASNQVKKCIRRITERMIDVVGKYFITPQEVQMMDSGNPVSFKIIGDRGKEIMRSIGENTDNLISIKKDAKVDVEIENGSAYTYQGKKELISQFMDRMMVAAKEGLVSPEALKLVMTKMVDIYKVGSISEFTEAMDKMPDNTTETDLLKMQTALAQVIKDLELAGPKASENRIMENKIGVVEGLKDAGLVKPPVEPEKVSQSISFKDLPASGQAQLAAKAGIQISPQEVQTEKDNAQQAEVAKAQQLQKVKLPVNKPNANTKK